jgi:hypothetical protein
LYNRDDVFFIGKRNRLNFSKDTGQIAFSCGEILYNSDALGSMQACPRRGGIPYEAITTDKARKKSRKNFPMLDPSKNEGGGQGRHTHNIDNVLMH